MTSLEDKIQELKKQNDELTKTAQFWRLQFRKCEVEKLNLAKENCDFLFRKKQYFNKVKRNCEVLMQMACKSMKDVLQFADYIENTLEIINEYDGTYDPVSREASTVNYTPSGSPSNVHHVRPMIQGVTLKTPVLRVSRANLDILNNKSAEKTVVKNEVPRNSPRALVQMNPLEVETNDTHSPNKKDKTLSPIQDEAGNGGNMNPEEVLKLKCSRELSVSLSRIDTLMQRYMNKDKSNSSLDENKDNKNDSEIENKENTFMNDDEIYNEEFQSNECLKYNSRLECILEETENESSNLTFNKTLCSSHSSIKDDIKTKEFIKTEQDPLEGPSWLFEDRNNSNEHSPIAKVSQYNFITLRKKAVINDSIFESSLSPSKDSDQMPDSTTDGKGNIIDSIEPPMINIPQSTPATEKPPIKCTLSPSVQQNLNMDDSKSNKDENMEQEIINERDTVIEESKSIILQAKGVKASVAKKNSKGKKSNVEKNRSSKVSNVRPRTDSEGSESSVKSSHSVPSNQPDCDSKDSCDSNDGLIRPRRGVTRKDYKEKSIVKKLRRN